MQPRSLRRALERTSSLQRRCARADRALVPRQRRPSERCAIWMRAPRESRGGRAGEASGWPKAQKNRKKNRRRKRPTHGQRGDGVVPDRPTELCFPLARLFATFVFATPPPDTRPTRHAGLPRPAAARPPFCARTGHAARPLPDASARRDAWRRTALVGPLDAVAHAAQDLGRGWCLAELRRLHSGWPSRHRHERVRKRAAQRVPAGGTGTAIAADASTQRRRDASLLLQAREACGAAGGHAAAIPAAWRQSMGAVWRRRRRRCGAAARRARRSRSCGPTLRGRAVFRSRSATFA